MLPLERIRLVHDLFPGLKIIFLMREPISRAWSHARHNFRYRESTFASSHPSFDEVTSEEWAANFRDPWPLASGDYLSHLRRWLSVFPREQVFVDFYEEIHRDPEGILRRLFQFLGVDADLSLDGFPLRQRIQAGMDKPLSQGLEHDLHGLLHHRSRQLIEFLHQDLGLVIPEEWQRIQRGSTGDSHPSINFDGFDPAEILRLEEDFPAAHRRLVEDHLGFEIVFFRRRIIALEHSVARVELTDDALLGDLIREGRCFVGTSVRDLKVKIDHLRLRQEQSRGKELENEIDLLQKKLVVAEGALEKNHARIDALEYSLWEAGQSVQHLERQIRKLRPWYRVLAGHLRDSWRGLRERCQASSTAQDVVLRRGDPS
ncbi:MAG: sulfotransferase domain-containing protein [Gemmataceae bacterium]